MLSHVDLPEWIAEGLRDAIRRAVAAETPSLH
jgi:hypothetical protein